MSPLSVRGNLLL